MQHPPKLVYPTKHRLVTMPPKLMIINHLMNEHFKLGRLDYVVNEIGQLGNIGSLGT